MIHPLHHQHVRKRESPYPHHTTWKRYIDGFVYVFGVLTPLFILPQLYVIWIDRIVDGISLYTWVAFFFSSVVWVLYGIAHKETPIIVVWSLAVVMKLFVVIGVLLFS